MSRLMSGKLEKETFRNYYEIIRNYDKLCEIIQYYAKLYNIMLNYAKLCEIIRNYAKWYEIMRKYSKLCRIMRNYTKLCEIMPSELSIIGVHFQGKTVRNQEIANEAFMLLSVDDLLCNVSIIFANHQKMLAARFSSRNRPKEKGNIFWRTLVQTTSKRPCFCRT